MAIAPGTIVVRSNPNQDLSGLSRSTDQAVNALGKIFDKKTVQEQQELAKVFGELAYEQVHIMSSNAKDAAQKDLDKAKAANASPEQIAALQAKVDSWDEGGANKIALHALVGGIMSDLGGSNFASGAVGAGVNEAIQKELSNIKDPALHQWASAVVGAAATKAVGEQAQAGASTATSGTKNNYLSNWQQGEKERQLAACTNDEERQNIEQYWNSVDTVQNAIMSGIGYTPQMLENDDNLMQQVASRAQEILSDPNATPGDYGGFKITSTSTVLVLIAGAYVALNINWETLTLGASALAKKADIKQIESVAKEFNMTAEQRRGFGDYVEYLKKEVPNNKNFSYAKLKEIAQEYLGVD